MKRYSLYFFSLSIIASTLYGAAQSVAQSTELALVHSLFERAQYAAAAEGYKTFFKADSASLDQLQCARVNLAQCLIAEGLDHNKPELWHEASSLFEERLALENRAPLQNPLDVTTDVRGKTIRVKTEYGFGDDVTFAPYYCTKLHELGANVVLELPGIHRLLASLFARMPGISKVITQHTPADEIPACDHEVYLMSLLGLINAQGYGPTDEHTIPIPAKPLLTADRTIAKEYTDEIKSNGKVNLAVCWKASRNPVAGGTRIINRDFPLRLLTEMAESTGYVKLWSVQGPPDKFVTESEFSRLEHQGLTEKIDPSLDVIPDRHVPYITQIADERAYPFENTATVIDACDAFAGCDTVFPNLAAALGQRTYFLLKAEQVDMRWGTKRNTTPWFPTAQLLRQSKPDDWQAPIAALTRAVAHIRKTSKK